MFEINGMLVELGAPSQRACCKMYVTVSSLRLCVSNY